MKLEDLQAYKNFPRLWWSGGAEPGMILMKTVSQFGVDWWVVGSEMGPCWEPDMTPPQYVQGPVGGLAYYKPEDLHVTEAEALADWLDKVWTRQNAVMKRLVALVGIGEVPGERSGGPELVREHVTALVETAARWGVSRGDVRACLDAVAREEGEPERPKHREEVIAGIRRQLEAIQEHFETARYWNKHVRKEGERALTMADVDPDGVLRKQGEEFAAILRAEDRRLVGPDPAALKPEA